MTASDGVRQQFTTLFDYGVFDKFPRLKVSCSSRAAGGSATGSTASTRSTATRSSAHACRSSTSRATTSASGCWISCDPDERTIPALAERFGADRFMWASDFPHADHTPEYVDDLDELAAGFPTTPTARRSSATTPAGCSASPTPPSPSDDLLVTLLVAHRTGRST